MSSNTCDTSVNMYICALKLALCSGEESCPVFAVRWRKLRGQDANIMIALALAQKLSVQKDDSVDGQGTSSEYKFCSRWKPESLFNVDIAWFKSAGETMIPGFVMIHFCYLMSSMSGTSFYKLLCSLYSLSPGQKQCLGEKPNIAAEFIIRAHFQLMCQFVKMRLVWNIEQVQMTCVGLKM